MFSFWRQLVNSLIQVRSCLPRAPNWWPGRRARLAADLRLLVAVGGDSTLRLRQKQPNQTSKLRRYPSFPPPPSLRVRASKSGRPSGLLLSKSHLVTFRVSFHRCRLKLMDPSTIVGSCTRCNLLQIKAPLKIERSKVNGGRGQTR